MRKIIWLVDMSLDGFMSGPNGELDWAAAQMDDELWDGMNELLGTVDAAVFGRVTYQNFEQYWRYWSGMPGTPSSLKNELNFSRWIEQTPKIVASKSLRRLEWQNSRLLGADGAEDISRMKEQSGKHLLMFGSWNFAAWMLKAGLIDELHIRVHPVTLGVGLPLFKEGSERHTLKLVGSKVTEAGLVQLQYNVARP